MLKIAIAVSLFGSIVYLWTNNSTPEVVVTDDEQEMKKLLQSRELEASFKKVMVQNNRIEEVQNPRSPSGIEESHSDEERERDEIVQKFKENFEFEDKVRYLHRLQEDIKFDQELIANAENNNMDTIELEDRLQSKERLLSELNGLLQEEQGSEESYEEK